MKRLVVTTLAVALTYGTFPASRVGAADCPPELSEAKAALAQAQVALKSARTGQPPREQAGARMQEVQAPRTDMKEVQAPRVSAKEVQAPRTDMKEVQAPRTDMKDIQAPKISKARALIRESERACQKGNLELSATKAKEALALLK